MQLRILRIDAERRRLGLSLRQADEVVEGEQATAETISEEVPSETAPQAETTSAPVAVAEPAPVEPEASSPAVALLPWSLSLACRTTVTRREGRGERRERSGESPLLGGLRGGRWRINRHG